MIKKNKNKVYYFIAILLVSFSLYFGYTQIEKAKSVNQAELKIQAGESVKNAAPKLNSAAFSKVILLSKAWLDTIRIDPLELRSHGIKGKKKLIELFEAYLAIYEFVSEAEQKSIEQRLSDIAQVTQSPEYHNLAFLPDEQFQEDATSYFRLCYLLEQKGLDTTLYRQEIKKILPRFNEHMPTRGVNQQMSFHNYYDYFQLEEPFPLDKAYEKGIIARRWTPEAMNDKDVYGLTHEIFAIYHYGDKPEVNFFSPDDKIYLRNVLKDLIPRYIEKKDPDLTAELLSCMCLLKMQDEPTFKKAVDYLLASQNPDGSFGNYENLRPIYEDYVKEGYYLHTTSVVLKALSLVFD